MNKIAINTQITNAKQLINILKDIQDRAIAAGSFVDGYESFKNSLTTLIKVLEETK